MGGVRPSRLCGCVLGREKYSGVYFRIEGGFLYFPGEWDLSSREAHGSRFLPLASTCDIHNARNVYVQLCWVYVRLLSTPFNRAGNADYLAQWQVRVYMRLTYILT